MIDITTLVPHRLTNEPSDDFMPSVSHDGKWIYFSSRRTGRSEIWRMPAEGGEAVQMTRQGGDMPFESLDGKLVYYRKDQDVWQVPAAGGEAIRLFGPIAENSFAVAADGIYFIEVGTPGHAVSTGNLLKFFSFAKGTAEKVGDFKLDPQVDGPLGVSPDGRYVLAELLDLDVCDLMLVENFH